MPTSPAVRLLFLSATACAVLPAVSFGSNARPVEAPRPTPERAWAAEREAFDGPTLGPEWFAGKRTVVYLVPEGEKAIARRAAALILERCWGDADWSLNHVFVASVSGRAKFAAARRVSLRKMAVRLAEELKQSEEFIETNEEHLRQTVLFVHDPEAETWEELLGTSPGDAEGLVPAVVLLESGRVVRAFELNQDDGASAVLDETGDAEQPLVGERELVTDVRRLLPQPRR